MLNTVFIPINAHAIINSPTPNIHKIFHDFMRYTCTTKCPSLVFKDCQIGRTGRCGDNTFVTNTQVVKQTGRCWDHTLLESPWVSKQLVSVEITPCHKQPGCQLAVLRSHLVTNHQGVNWQVWSHLGYKQPGCQLAGVITPWLQSTRVSNNW